MVTTNAGIRFVDYHLRVEHQACATPIHVPLLPSVSDVDARRPARQGHVPQQSGGEGIMLVA